MMRSLLLRRAVAGQRSLFPSPATPGPSAASPGQLALLPSKGDPTVRRWQHAGGQTTPPIPEGEPRFERLMSDLERGTGAVHVRDRNEGHVHAAIMHGLVTAHRNSPHYAYSHHVALTDWGHRWLAQRREQREAEHQRKQVALFKGIVLLWKAPAAARILPGQLGLFAPSGGGGGTTRAQQAPQVQQPRPEAPKPEHAPQAQPRARAPHPGTLLPLDAPQHAQGPLQVVHVRGHERQLPDGQVVEVAPHTVVRHGSAHEPVSGPGKHLKADVVAALSKHGRDLTRAHAAVHAAQHEAGDWTEPLHSPLSADDLHAREDLWPKTTGDGWHVPAFEPHPDVHDVVESDGERLALTEAKEDRAIRYGDVSALALSIIPPLAIARIHRYEHPEQDEDPIHLPEGTPMPPVRQGWLEVAEDFRRALKPVLLKGTATPADVRAVYEAVVAERAGELRAMLDDLDSKSGRDSSEIRVYRSHHFSLSSEYELRETESGVKRWHRIRGDETDPDQRITMIGPQRGTEDRPIERVHEVHWTHEQKEKLTKDLGHDEAVSRGTGEGEADLAAQAPDLLHLKKREFGLRNTHPLWNELRLEQRVFEPRHHGDDWGVRFVGDQIGKDFKRLSNRQAIFQAKFQRRLETVWHGLPMQQRRELYQHFFEPHLEGARTWPDDASKHNGKLSDPPGLDGWGRAGRGWHEYQAKAVNWYDSLPSGRGNFLLEMGLGKAQAFSSMILTPCGWTTMGTVRPGDLVVDPVTGGEQLVLGWYPQGVRPVFKVTFSDGAVARCDDEHLWEVNTALRRWRGQPTRVLTLREIRQKLVSSAGNRLHFIPIMEPFAGRPTDVPLDPYLLGYLIGNGGLTGSTPKVTIPDEETVQRLREALPPGVACKHIERMDYSLGGTNGINGLTGALRHLRLMGKGSPEKWIPDLYLYAARGQRLALLRGIMDADGWVSDGVTGFSSSSERLALDVQALVRALGGIATKTIKSEPKYEHNGETRVGLPAHILTINLPECPFTLSRKAEPWESHDKYPPTRSIVSVEPDGEEECACVRVSGERGLFVTDDYVVTHNTVLALAAYHKKRAAGRVDKMLIVAPMSTHGSWLEHVRDFSDAGIVFAYGGPKGRKKAIEAWKGGKQQVLVITPESLAKDETREAIREAMGPDPSRVFRVADEVHKFKNPEAARTLSARQLFDLPGPAIGMTGTPQPNAPEDLLWVQRFIDREAFLPERTRQGMRDEGSTATQAKHLDRDAFLHFVETYTHSFEDDAPGGRRQRGGPQLVVAGYNRQMQNELRAEVAARSFVRTLKDDDVKVNLPDMLTLSPSIPLSPSQERMAAWTVSYSAWEERVRQLERLAEVSDNPAHSAHATMARAELTSHGEHNEDALGRMGYEARVGSTQALIGAMKQIAVSPEAALESKGRGAMWREHAPKDEHETPKMQFILDHAAEHLESNPGKGVVIMGEYHGALDVAKLGLLDRGIPEAQIARIDGRTDPKKKLQIQDDFNAGKYRVLLGGTGSLETGANLQKNSSFLAHLTTPYNPTTLSQSTARVWRQGQKSITTVLRPVGSPVEQAIEGIVGRKLAESAVSLGGTGLGEEKIAQSMLIKRGHAAAKLGAWMDEALRETPAARDDRLRRERIMDGGTISEFAGLFGFDTKPEGAAMKKGVQGWHFLS